MKNKQGDQDFGNKEKRLGVAQKNHQKTLIKQNLVISKKEFQKEFGLISSFKLNMIDNLLPNEATHSSLDLFEKPTLLVTFDGSFCQKLGPVYSPVGPMIEFELTGDRNNFIDLQKIFFEIKCKIVQSSGAYLKYDGAATADTARTDAPYFCNNVLHSLFSDCTVSANGLKISNANGNYAHKSFIETEFSYNKGAKNTWLAFQGYSYEEDPSAIKAAKITRRKNLVRE